ncbi:uncharacterized protein EV420DRAFT_1621487 [Desarmillaria tabescens]|uniref:Uncharacterized protein n=1 Tax=Armillaria tabescens TaxID=1929756 RepID=A0AA39K6N7_ARMTA|nr:uncharacterized protein EV420DRAFT_1621487 [Desarmillaria tabescens]KAK0454209.1 hypothetical protein EV420DRAFT_1621487 [Desarmillaria tabescens]
MRKPIIYLYSPQPVHAVVQVSLVKAWSFSAVYPNVPIKDSEIGQSVLWEVDVQKDHTLTTTNGTRVSYLFWEAENTNSILPFDPSFGRITNENSVVLRASQAAEYLDKALLALSLHVEARISFITYWLPSILKHDYVALTFLPQSSYSCAAPLSVDPKPDIITRVFMLFKRVHDDELVEWEGALTRAFEEVDCWKGVVGVDGDGMDDEALFRVFEWGGMEVVH